MKRKEANANPGAAKLRGGKPMPKWKQQSQAFRASLQAANIKDTNSEEYARAAAMASQANEESLTKCPHCNRSFNEDAAKRHMPICAKKAKDTQFKKGPPPRRR